MGVFKILCSLSETTLLLLPNLLLTTQLLRTKGETSAIFAKTPPPTEHRTALPSLIAPFPLITGVAHWSKSKGTGFKTLGDPITLELFSQPLGPKPQEHLLLLLGFLSGFWPLARRPMSGSGVPIKGWRPGKGLAPLRMGTGEPGSSLSTYMNWPSCILSLITRSSWSKGRLTYMEWEESESLM
ncbi:LEUNIG_homolog [Striga asiatica]|uniref:LEUNIG_homolog n=1 Tax=Striga asiatica TaxID=4170 RepID=A0A5A7PH89_STRAF|nr:LEUNIG_homolog [Striga asiatica]